MWRRVGRISRRRVGLGGRREIGAEKATAEVARARHAKAAGRVDATRLGVGERGLRGERRRASRQRLQLAVEVFGQVLAAAVVVCRMLHDLRWWRSLGVDGRRLSVEFEGLRFAGDIIVHGRLS